jgi:hypothetical protein
VPRNQTSPWRIPPRVSVPYRDDTIVFDASLDFAAQGQFYVRRDL